MGLFNTTLNNPIIISIRFVILSLSAYSTLLLIIYTHLYAHTYSPSLSSSIHLAHTHTHSLTLPLSIHLALTLTLYLPPPYISLGVFCIAPLLVHIIVLGEALVVLQVGERCCLDTDVEGPAAVVAEWYPSERHLPAV